jgi:hypothetical protein
MRCDIQISEYQEEEYDLSLSYANSSPLFTH